MFSVMCKYETGIRKIDGVYSTATNALPTAAS